MMRLANPAGKAIAALALLVWLAPDAGAQAKQPAKRPQKRRAAAAAAARPAAERPVRVARRDPFDPLIAKQRPGAAPILPPGKAGLQVGTLRVDGLVRAPSGMIAVISSPQQRVYFLREGDQLYDGQVEKITLEDITFRERGKDPFGKTYERQVIKRLYPSAGEQR